MSLRYSDYSIEALKEEERRLKEELIKAEQHGLVSEVAILQRKLQMVISYTMFPGDFNVGQTYVFKDMPNQSFKVTKVKGVMAWGYRVGDHEESTKEEAIPISLLEHVKK
ncbi:MAG TPA: DUF1811 family protein [Bacillota bacterium]|nr:DUF1811 family protein [Bacillota bacterium]